jgi:transcriptional regulator GlxA family with amidase domain
VQARAGLKLDPDFTIEEHPKLDCLIVPGGVVTAELHRPQLLAWLNQQMQQVPITASVCTGAFLLAQTGRLDGLDVITHWEDISDLRAAFPMVQIKEGVRWTDNGAVVTSAGISAGIDMSLHLVERMADRALALRTAKQMDFEWKENQLHG